MNQDESIALWRQGKEAWNAWAEDMLRQKAELEKVGLWLVDENGAGKNDETDAWVSAATVDLQRCKFHETPLTEYGDPDDEKEHEIDVGEEQIGYRAVFVEKDLISFSEFTFPWILDLRNSHFEAKVIFSGSRFQALVKFNHTEFHKEAEFRRAQFHEEARFGYARFHGGARFGASQFHRAAGFEAQFHEDALFDKVQFHKQARFESAQFHGQARFYAAQFHRDAWLGSAKFGGAASFDGTQFHQQTWFVGSTFQESAWFGNVHFHGVLAFGGAELCGQTVFENAQFHREAVFANVKFLNLAEFTRSQFRERATFENAIFESTTSFADAKFGTKEKPQDADFTAIKADRAFDLTRAVFSKVPAFNQADFKQAPDLDSVSFPPRPFWLGGDVGLIPKYRHIKRLAIQGHDYEREQMAFKGELRSRRWVVDKWYGPSVWLGLLYDGVADCGRSIWRPFFTWALVALVFAGVYLWNAGIDVEAWRETCPNAPVSKLLKAVSLSISNAVPVIGASRTQEVQAIYECLYADPAAPGKFAVAAWSPILQVAQNVLSAVLIFLFLLGVRNQFKIK